MKTNLRLNGNSEKSEDSINLIKNMFTEITAEHFLNMEKQLVIWNSKAYHIREQWKHK